MTTADAIQSGLLTAGTPHPVEGCPTPALAWKPPYDDQLDVFVNDDNLIVSIGTLKGSSVKTSEGIGLGDTYIEVNEAYPNGELKDNIGYGQSGYIVKEGNKYIGFLFNPRVANLKDETPMTLIEVTKDRVPSLMRDGC